LATSIQPGDWIGTLDLKDGFWHVPIRENHQDLLGIEWKGRFFVFRTLLFGLSLAPYAFTKVMRCVVVELRQKGVRCQVYMDDLILLASFQEEWLKARKLTLDLLLELGLNVNWEKSDLVPAQRKEWLGMEIDATGEHVQFRISAKKLHAIQHECARLVRRADIPPFPLIKRVVAKLVEQLAEVTVIVPFWEAQEWFHLLKKRGGRSADASSQGFRTGAIRERGIMEE
jgi:hypothetical protein